MSTAEEAFSLSDSRLQDTDKNTHAHTHRHIHSAGLVLMNTLPPVQ